MPVAQAWNAGIGFKRVLPPRSLTYTLTSPAYTKWTAIANNSPTWQGHAVTSWSISPALPAGLIFNTTTGVISGTPTSSTYSASHTVAAANAGGSATVILTVSVALSPYTWLGTTSNVWATGTNWSGGAAPSLNTHVAIFDNECTQCNANISAAVTARSIQMKSNYAGTITQVAGVGNTINLGTNNSSTFGGFIIDAGTFAGGTANIRADYLQLNAGSFTSTSAELRLGFNTAHGVNTGFGFEVSSTATFTHNSGLLYMDAQTSSDSDRFCGTIKADQTVVLHKLAIDCQDTTADQSYDSSSFTISGTSKILQVMSELHAYDGWTSFGTIEFYGADADFYCDSAVTPNICAGVIDQNFQGSGDESTHLVFKGAAAQTYTFQDGAGGPTFRIENSNGVTPGGGTGTFTIFALDAVTGTFTAPASTLQFLGRTRIHFQNNLKGITVGASGGFAHNNGTVILAGGNNVYADSRTSFTFTLASNAITFNNLTLNFEAHNGASVGRENNETRIAAGTTITILKDLTVKAGRFIESGTGINPILIIRGNYRRECANYITHACADVDSAVDKQFDTNLSTIHVDNPGETECSGCTYTFNPGAGNTVTLTSGDMNLISTTTNVVVTSGTLHIAAGAGVVLRGNLTNNAAITCAVGEFIYYTGTLTGTPGAGNNTSCYRATPVDAIPAAVDWIDFSGISTTQTFSGLDHAARLEISVANGVGTPTLQYRLDGGSNAAWTTIVVGTPAAITIMNGHFLEFRVTGTATHSGVFTIRNTTDANNVIDTVTGTVP